MTTGNDVLQYRDMEVEDSYFKSWYARNGGKLNASRRDRYKSDPEYRAKVLERNRKSREKKRRTLDEEKTKRREAVRTRPRNAWKTASVEINGERVKAFTIGAAAKALGCSAQALRLWEKRGHIPETKYRHGKGDRLYTTSQIEELRRILTEQGRIGDGRTAGKRNYIVRDLMVPGRKNPRKNVRLYKVGTLAKVLGKTVGAIDRMSAAGVLPATPLRSKSTNQRLFTYEMMISIKKILDSETSGLTHDRVYREWTKQGIIGAEIKE